MARKVKLHDTGEIAEKNSSMFQAPDKRWFSSYDAYLAYDLDNQTRIKCIDKMFDIMGYSSGQKINTSFFKRLKEWREGYTYNVILKAMEMSIDSIDYAKRTKQFDSEWNKLSYFMAIIQNKLNDALNISKLERKVNKIDNNKDLDIFADGIETTQYICGNVKANNVSELAGDL